MEDFSARPCRRGVTFRLAGGELRQSRALLARDQEQTRISLPSVYDRMASARVETRAAVRSLKITVQREAVAQA
ncbi:MAG TPA: hypothetical protein PKA88_31660, partial [Polyangiaceae bacterium]|nr:hypothetical protein [Polyangiaceae bacterium]